MAQASSPLRLRIESDPANVSLVRQAVEKLCASTHFAHLNPLVARVRSLGALFAQRSLSLDYYRDQGLSSWVERTVAEHKIDRILVFSSAMAQYAESYPNARRVVDFVDVDSDKWRQYAEKKPWPMSWACRSAPVAPTAPAASDCQPEGLPVKFQEASRSAGAR